MKRTASPAAVASVALLALVPTSPAVAGDHRGGGGEETIVYPLPGDNVFPEGVDTFDGYFYVTSTSTGEVFRGELDDEDSAETFLAGGEDGRTVAVGIEATEDLLLIAGGPTGTVFIYDRESGEFVSSHEIPGEGPAFLNDIAVTPNGDVYVTDSPTDIIYRIDGADVDESTPLEVFSAELAERDPVGQFNANGILSARDGRYLIVVESDTGRLFRISTRNASVREIDLDGATVVGGDGLELRHRTLYVVRGREVAESGEGVGVVTVVRLKDRFKNGRIVDEITDPTFLVPTTAALTDDRLLVVNSQFNRTPALPFTVSSVPLADTDEEHR